MSPFPSTPSRYLATSALRTGRLRWHNRVRAPGTLCTAPGQVRFRAVAAAKQCVSTLSDRSPRFRCTAPAHVRGRGCDGLELSWQGRRAQVDKFRDEANAWVADYRRQGSAIAISVTARSSVQSCLTVTERPPPGITPASHEQDDVARWYGVPDTGRIPRGVCGRLVFNQLERAATP